VNILIADDDPLVGLTLRHFIEKAAPPVQSSHVLDGASALRALRTGSFDAVFLDLELPELDGRGVLQALPAGFPVVVVSSHTDFAARSYDFDVVDYLVKPLEFARFHRAWEKLLGRLQQPGGAGARSLVVRDGSRLVPVNLDHLLYLEAELNYTRFVGADRTLLALVSMKHLAETLPPEFLRVHRSFIINTRFVRQVEGSAVRVGERAIPIGETYRETVLARFAPI
jgi:DNA-binding LytR/AlgR family response regulator